MHGGPENSGSTWMTVQLPRCDNLAPIYSASFSEPESLFFFTSFLVSVFLGPSRRVSFVLMRRAERATPRRTRPCKRAVGHAGASAGEKKEKPKRNARRACLRMQS